ncbi:MAG: hypothetical protein J6J61_02300, partial [Muribaculaceae bacterium]|nr:hypothetical protein [Muribaculaceae bacterium]
MDTSPMMVRVPSALSSEIAPDGAVCSDCASLTPAAATRAILSTGVINASSFRCSTYASHGS